MGARVVALTTAFLIGCAPALSSFSGARTTPEGHGDVAIGASARAPLGDLARPSDQPIVGLTSPGGIAPAGFFRVGIDRSWDLGVLVAGTTGRLELRVSHPLSTAAYVLAGVSGYGGYVRRDQDPEGPGDGFRAGGLVPLVLGINAGGIFEAWGGLRLGYEHAQGTLDAMTVSGDANAFRGGLVVGLAIGFLHIHALIELAADYEYWRGQLAGVTFERQGIALVPGFALRVRF
jgi:hypothetical protein